MSSPFKLTQHVIRGQHIRQNPAATVAESQPLRISINQYEPRSRAPQDGDVTIIAAHANGYTRELYEPLFEDLLHHSRQPIRAIWIADISNQGASGLLNEPNLGNAPDYFDYSRDLLHMVNTFRDSMPPPLVGIGHSIGSVSLVYLSFIHPSLFASLILIETFISDRSVPNSIQMRKAMVNRRDRWPSREAAEASLRKGPLARTWDLRAFDRLIAYNFRQNPTALYPGNDGSVTLRTPKHQVAFLAHLSDEPLRPEAYRAFPLLPLLQPPVLFIYGSRTNVTTAEERRMRLNQTGTGFGGSGGVEAGMVKEVELEGTHTVPFERVAETAQAICSFMQDHLTSWHARRKAWKDKWSNMSQRDKQTISADLIEIIKIEEARAKSKI